MEKFLDVLNLNSHGVLEGNNGFHVKGGATLFSRGSNEPPDFKKKKLYI